MQTRMSMAGPLWDKISQCQMVAFQQMLWYYFVMPQARRCFFESTFELAAHLNSKVLQRGIAWNLKPKLE